MRPRNIAVVVCLTIALAAAAYQTSAAGKARGFSMHDKPRAVPVLTFQDGTGRALRLSDFKGKVVVLNLWATWCAPCREEMPTLDRLQGQLGGKDLEVLALSVDAGGPQKVREFFQKIGVKNLRLYIDPTSQAVDKLSVLGLPVTLLIDQSGRELGRLVGTTVWDSPEMVQFLRGVIGPKREGRTVGVPSATTSS